MHTSLPKCEVLEGHDLSCTCPKGLRRVDQERHRTDLFLISQLGELIAWVSLMPTVWWRDNLDVWLSRLLWLNILRTHSGKLKTLCVKNKWCLFFGSHVNVRVYVSAGIVFRLKFASRTGHFRLEHQLARIQPFSNWLARETDVSLVVGQ